MSTESSNSHISWLVCEQLLRHLSWRLSHLPLMEILWLIVLLPVLGSLLICVNVAFGGPASAIPKSWVHYIARAIIDQYLPWSVEIGFVGHMSVDIKCILGWELPAWVSGSINLTWVSLRVDKACSECGLVWSVVCMISWVSIWHGSQAVSSRGGMEGVIVLRDVWFVKTVNRLELWIIVLTRWSSWFELDRPYVTLSIHLCFARWFFFEVVSWLWGLERNLSTWGSRNSFYRRICPDEKDDELIEIVLLTLLAMSLYEVLYILPLVHLKNSGSAILSFFLKLLNWNLFLVSPR